MDIIACRVVLGIASVEDTLKNKFRDRGTTVMVIQVINRCMGTVTLVASIKVNIFIQ